jgi:hypothetical protein
MDRVAALTLRAAIPLGAAAEARHDDVLVAGGVLDD